MDLRKPLEPSEAVASIVVPDGFRIELVAAEPLVRDPMAMEFDENGVAYVLEIPSYNGFDKNPRAPGSIARLIDTDGDGRFDRRNTYAASLKYPTGLFCYDGGLFVGDPPELLYLRDTDGDGIADEREVVLSGFGAGSAGESQLNSFRWGLDNRIHINTGLDGGDIRPANLPDAPARSIRNRRILLEPRSRTFQLTSGGGQHGMSFDDWGRVFACENSQPIQVITYDDRYIERNPLMSAPSPLANIGPGTNYTKLVRISEPENWRRIRENLLEHGARVTDTYEWDRASGVITSATGITIYRGDAWGDDWRGDAFIGEVVNNLVYHARLTTDGLDVTSQRVGPESGFLASTDTWFRPVQFAHGPDGNLYVVDMYRELIEGVQWVPPEVLAKMDPTDGNDRGRIYRIVRENFQQPPPAQLGRMTTHDLVAALSHKNGWHRDTAARLIYERQDKATVEPLRRLLADSNAPQARMHALCALGGLGALGAGDVRRGLHDPHPRVREHAARLAEKLAPHFAEVSQELAGLINDDDVAVRLQTTFSLGSIPPGGRMHALVDVLQADGADPRFRVAIQSALGSGAADFAGAILADGQLPGIEHVREFLVTLANQIGRSGSQRDIRIVVAAIDKLASDHKVQESLGKDLAVALLAEGSGASTDVLAAQSAGRVSRIVADLLSTAHDTALNQNEQPGSRMEAITLLGCGSFAASRPALDALLTPQQPQPIQEAVVQILSRFSDAGVVELLLAKWTSLTPALRSSAVEVLLSRPAWAESLLNAVEKNEISAGDFDPARVALLKRHPSRRVRDLAGTVFANTQIARRADVVARYQRALQLSASPDAGRAVFEKSCAACHELEGRGTQIGAELVSIRDKGREAMMLNILDPNREINPQYLAYLVVTTDGRTITGMIAEETPNNLTIRQADGTQVPVLRTDLDEMESTGMSYMPEGLESQIDHQAMADLLAYLVTADTGQGTGSGEQGAESEE
jgi:putative membrane-bound dehydrogenase-like protein